MSELQDTPELDELSQFPPKNYLVESIILTAFCCMPLGVVSLIHATKVNSAWESGDKAGAQRASDEAKKWVKWGFIAGGAAFILLMVFYAVIIIGAIAAEGM